jgi:general secretion pathway protein A
MITGEPGTGKTTLINVFRQRWADRSDIALILTPRLSPDELMLTLLRELQLPAASATKNDMLKTLQDFLVARHRSGSQVIIIVDEAHDMPDETLEELRLLSNLETPTEKLVQIILVGQPELGRRLKESRLRQLDQRIVERMQLRPLTKGETGQYLHYRLAKAHSGALSITASMTGRIHRFSRGLPRLINLVASRSIMCAYMDGSPEISPPHVKYAINYFTSRGYSAQPFRQRRSVYTGAAAGIAALVIFLVIATDFSRRGGGFRRDMQIPRARTSAHIVASAGAEEYTTVELRPEDEKAGKEHRQKQHPKNRLKKRPLNQPETGSVRLAVSAATASVRNGPGLHASVIGYVHKGDTLASNGRALDDRNKTWYRLSGDNKKGRWVSSKVVTVLDP